MPYLVGVDEAGYGPNLGPLVVSATLWRVAPESFPIDLYEVLKQVISPQPTTGDDQRIAIADSKTLYKPGSGLRLLERGVLPALLSCGQIDMSAISWRTIWQTLTPTEEKRSAVPWRTGPWYEKYDSAIPCDLDAKVLSPLAEHLSQGLRMQDVQLLAVRSRSVFPGQWNDLIDRHGGKGAALSRVTLNLVKDILAKTADESCLVLCDKHGGRNKYGPLLQETFPDRLVEVRGESRRQSIYRWGPAKGGVEIRFTAKGECFLPAALASMTSKYLRELAMAAFNQFWRRHLPHVKPTAGYPLDARRFKREIEAKQRELAIDDRILWRNR